MASPDNKMAELRSTPAAVPTISIVTVVRNGMPFVANTIDSVLAQTYRPLEYIVVDGGSSDGTVDIIKSRQSRITRWLSEKDEGIADAFNKGLALTSGDYILFLNADDALAHPEVVNTVVREIVRNGFPTFVYGDCDVLERKSGRVLYRAVIPFEPSGLRRGKMPPHPSLFTRCRYFEQYGGFDPSFRIAMDFEWFLRGVRHERVVHLPALTTLVRTGGVSALQRHHAVNEIVRALRKNGYAKTLRDEIVLKAYFSGRATAKLMLKTLGLYGWFDRIRQSLGNAVRGKTNRHVQ
jgi:glycosyltransferase involved in cell wall biosynthesis